MAVGIHVEITPSIVLMQVSIVNIMAIAPFLWISFVARVVRNSMSIIHILFIYFRSPQWIRTFENSKISNLVVAFLVFSILGRRVPTL